MEILGNPKNSVLPLAGRIRNLEKLRANTPFRVFSPLLYQLSYLASDVKGQSKGRPPAASTGISVAGYTSRKQTHRALSIRSARAMIRRQSPSSGSVLIWKSVGTHCATGRTISRLAGDSCSAIVCNNGYLSTILAVFSTESQNCERGA